MSLATRCIACGTVFRVVQDQLELFDGWVRCGRCDAVFSAFDGLFTLHRDTPPGGLDQPRIELVAPSESVPVIQAAEAADPDLVDRIDAQLFGRRDGMPPPAALPDAQRVPPRIVPVVGETDTASAALPNDPAAHAPAFIRDADRQARWRRSSHRSTLALGVLALVIGLVLQVAHHFRDIGAARWPMARGVLGAWCAAAGCTLQAPRRIDAISVESTALTRAAAAPDAFVLAVTLRNRTGMALAMPSIDLSLTEIGGRLVARRALAPGDFRAPAALPAGAEAPLQVLLSAGTLQVAGYSVEIFYP